jgi:hypothetical protein
MKLSDPVVGPTDFRAVRIHRSKPHAFLRAVSAAMDAAEATHSLDACGLHGADCFIFAAVTGSRNMSMRGRE